MFFFLWQSTTAFLSDTILVEITTDQFPTSAGNCMTVHAQECADLFIPAVAQPPPFQPAL